MIGIDDASLGAVMRSDPVGLYSSLLSAGAILAGFCGTFLAFRIQREANYYRQPALDFDTGRARDVYVGLTHFTSGFLLLGMASICTCVFGVVFPLLVLAGSDWFLDHTRVAVAGVVGGLVLLVAYFVNELIHYRVLSSRLVGDAREWGREWIVVVLGIAVAAAMAVCVKTLLP
jgi:hypothetical protein